MNSGDRPRPPALVDRYFAAARIAHEYVYDLHRELVELGAADDHTRELLAESAAMVFERMPNLTQRCRELERLWAEQAVLHPPASRGTVERLERDLAEVAPALVTLRARQNEIVAELRDLTEKRR
jgi:hypothetical protein